MGYSLTKKLQSTYTDARDTHNPIPVSATLKEVSATFTTSFPFFFPTARLSAVFLSLFTLVMVLVLVVVLAFLLICLRYLKGVSG